jgi:hypothetical protein
VREESHLDDMRSAIRGDFERLARRRGGQELLRPPEPRPEPDLAAEPAQVEEPVPEPNSMRAELEHEAASDAPAPADEPLDEAPEQPVEDAAGEPADESGPLAAEAHAGAPDAEISDEGSRPDEAGEPEEPARRGFIDWILGR